MGLATIPQVITGGLMATRTIDVRIGAIDTGHIIAGTIIELAAPGRRIVDNSGLARRTPPGVVEEGVLGPDCTKEISAPLEYDRSAPLFDIPTRSQRYAGRLTEKASPATKRWAIFIESRGLANRPAMAHMPFVAMFCSSAGTLCP
jgi:hypothetical protein